MPRKAAGREARLRSVEAMYPPMRKPHRDDASVIVSAGPFKVVSRTDGSFTISAAWQKHAPAACRMSPEKYCFGHDCYHIGGVFTRIATAEAIQALLNSLSGPAAKPPKKAGGARGGTGKGRER